MTDAAHATPGPLPPPPHRSHGCLWGCLIAAGIAVAAIVAAVTWSSWYLNSGFKDNDTIKIIAEQLNANATARSVLGDKIEITSLTGSHYSTELSRGTDEAYSAKVKGSKAEGTISIKVKTPPGGTRHIDELILTGPDGRTYNLLATAPPVEDSAGGGQGGATNDGDGHGMNGGETRPPGGDDADSTNTQRSHHGDAI